ncbi:MAG TPA: CBS domain-containing protein [Polyangiaceae bacterium]|jgi:CBS domain-containing protein
MLLYLAEERTMAIAEILREKGADVYQIGPNATVFTAIQLMVARGVGSVAVVEDGRLIGMLTERDYLRKVVLEGRTSRATLVREIMTPRVIVAMPSDGIDDCLGVMTTHRVRHLPVLEHGRLIGLVSMGDLVKRKVAEKEREISQLVEYIQTAGCPLA